jgi:hypothetical protein
LLNHRKTDKLFISINEMADLLNLNPHIAKRLKERVSFSKLKPVLRPSVSIPIPEQPIPESIPMLGCCRVID